MEQPNKLFTLLSMTILELDHFFSSMPSDKVLNFEIDNLFIADTCGFTIVKKQSTPAESLAKIKKCYEAILFQNRHIIEYDYRVSKREINMNSYFEGEKDTKILLREFNLLNEEVRFSDEKREMYSLKYLLSLLFS